jgi:hypothetical protein
MFPQMTQMNAEKNKGFKSKLCEYPRNQRAKNKNYD